MTENNKEYEKVVTHHGDEDSVQKNPCQVVADKEELKEEKRAKREFKFFALKTLTITVAGVIFGLTSSLIYGYAANDKEMDKGIIDTVFSTIVEIIKILL